jgi:anti-sigma-K factor RskA
VADGRAVRLAPLQGARAPAGERAFVTLPGRAAGTVDLRARHLPASAPGTYYEVWLMTDEHRLASVGTFRVPSSGTVHVRFAVGVDPAAYRYVDVSVERDDGQPAHSGTSVLRSGALS